MKFSKTKIIFSILILFCVCIIFGVREGMNEGEFNVAHITKPFTNFVARPISGSVNNTSNSTSTIDKNYIAISTLDIDFKKNNQLTNSLGEKLISQFNIPDPVQHSDLAYTSYAYLNGKIYAVTLEGGQISKGNSVWSSSDDGKTWVELSHPFPRMLSGPQLVVFQNKLWLIGQSIWSSSDGVVWDKISEDTAFSYVKFNNGVTVGGAVGYSVVVFKDKIWVIGGNGPASIWSSSDGKTWVHVTTDAPWGSRMDPVLTVFQNKLWFIGDTRSKSFDVWSSVDGVHWIPVALKTPFDSSRSIDFYNKAVVYGNEIYFIQVSKIWSSPDGINWKFVSKNQTNQTRAFLAIPSVSSVSQEDNTPITIPACVSPSVSISVLYPEGHTPVTVYSNQHGRGVSYLLKAGGKNCMIRVNNIHFKITPSADGNDISASEDVQLSVPWLYSMPILTSDGIVISGNQGDVLLNIGANPTGTLQIIPTKIDAVDENGNPVMIINGLGDESKITIIGNPTQAPLEDCQIKHIPCG